MYEQLVAKIVEAVPEIIEAKCDCDSDAGTHLWKRDITLEDVLRTAGDLGIWLSVSERGLLKGLVATRVNYFWTLGKPLSEQSPETIDYLHSLLVSQALQ